MEPVQSTESSVLFNLRQLMQLESERVAAEESAARERAAAVERARIEEARRAASEALRLEREREAELLRAQLSAAADERVRRDSLELEHARELRVIEARTRRARAAIAVAGLAFTLIGGAGAHAWLSAPRVVRVASRVPAVAQPTVRAEQESELASLREQLARLIASQSQLQPVVAPTPKRRVEAKHERVAIRALPKPDSDPLRSIDGNDGDPIKGM